MNDFDYDVLQKKKLAQQARHRKGTKGRKGCTLPSDYLTPKQLKERNGPIMTVKLNQPMKWDEFNALSDTLKLEYLNAIKEKFFPTTRELAEMFGKNRAILNEETKRLGFKTGHIRGNDRGTAAEKAARAKAFRDFWDKEPTTDIISEHWGETEDKNDCVEYIAGEHIFSSNLDAIKDAEKELNDQIMKGATSQDAFSAFETKLGISHDYLKTSWQDEPRIARMCSSFFNFSGNQQELTEFMSRIAKLLMSDKIYSIEMNIQEVNRDE